MTGPIKVPPMQKLNRGKAARTLNIIEKFVNAFFNNIAFRERNYLHNIPSAGDGRPAFLRWITSAYDAGRYNLNKFLCRLL